MMKYDKDIKDVVLYTKSFDTAKANGETDLWRASVSANIDCSRCIEQIIEAGYDYPHLSSECAKKVIDIFGFDRVNYILKFNVKRFPKEDPRISDKNKKWGETFYTYKENCRTEYLIKSHPGLLNLFIDQARREWDKLNLWEPKDCYPLTGEDLTQRILVLSPSFLKDEFKTPENQLVFATAGFGCNPSASGQKVFGFFVKDGEESSFQRSDFIGILKEENIPENIKNDCELITK